MENAGYQTATDVANTIADTKVSDLSDGDDYVKNTDYATSSVGGVIKSSTTIGTYTTSDGDLYASERSYSQYSGMTRNGFISKGTLENVIAGKAIKSTWTGTQAEYDALTTYDDNTDYRIVEA